jgi:hypothetical protein
MCNFLLSLVAPAWAPSHQAYAFCLLCLPSLLLLLLLMLALVQAVWLLSTGS